MNEKADDIRKKYAYRQLILKGKIKVSRQTAVKLIGPDTAYHLYSHKESAKKGKGQ
ncbi:MAG: hypothetical protein O3B73_01415 [bacterium]|nr:hypothetical protein [bacterium]